MKKSLKSPILWGVLVALLVAIPPVTSYRFIGTDCTQVGVLEGLIHYPGMGPLTLYRFSDGTPEHMSALVSAGFYPWFSTPQGKMNMCRHLSSALTALNHKISGLHPLGYALHSLLWYLVLIVLVGLLVRRIVPGPGSSVGNTNGSWWEPWAQCSRWPRCSPVPAWCLSSPWAVRSC